MSHLPMDNSGDAKEIRSSTSQNEIPLSRSNTHKSTTSSIEGVHERLKLAQSYELPPMIKGIIDGNTSQANAVAVTAALFAGILATIAQTLPPDQNSSKHKALQFFIVSAIVVNVSGAAYALFALFALAQIPNYTASQIVKKPTSLAYKVAMGGTLPPKLIGTDEFMLAAFHPDARALIWAGTGVVTTCWFGSILTFVAITLWIWLQYDTVVAGATMIFLVPCCASLLWIIYGNISSMWKLVDIDWEERYKDIE